jgi:hypothetical protein
LLHWAAGRTYNLLSWSALQLALKGALAMRNKVLGVIGIVWGGAMLVSFFMRGANLGGGAYAAGQLLGLIMGGVMLVAGVVAVRK